MQQQQKQLKLSAKIIISYFKNYFEIFINDSSLVTLAVILENLKISKDHILNSICL